MAHDAVAGGSLKSWDGLSLSSLLPGMLVTARIRQVGRGGLVASFGGWFSGTIDASHLPVTPGEDWSKRYQVGQKVPSRLLYVDQSNKSIGLSCLTHILNLRLPTAVPAMGQVRVVGSVCAHRMNECVAASGSDGAGAACCGCLLGRVWKVHATTQAVTPVACAHVMQGEGCSLFSALRRLSYHPTPQPTRPPQTWCADSWSCALLTQLACFCHPAPPCMCVRP